LRKLKQLADVTYFMLKCVLWLFYAKMCIISSIAMYYG